MRNTDQTGPRAIEARTRLEVKPSWSKFNDRGLPNALSHTASSATTSSPEDDDQPVGYIRFTVDPTCCNRFPEHRKSWPRFRHLMSNLLVFPFKKTTVIPVSHAARKYIQDHLPDSNPDAFTWDLKQWEALRKQSSSDVIHVDLIQHFLECVAGRGQVLSLLIPGSYQAQLMFILTKLPADVSPPL